jgi:hypothetical protein
MNWRKSGLDKASWCKGKKLIKYTREEFYKLVTPTDFRGRVTETDFHFIIDKLDKLHHLENR